MEGLGYALLAFIGFAWVFYSSWRDNRRWNEGVCKETGQLWEFTGGVSTMGYFCYRGGVHKGKPQFIWLSELRKRPYHFGMGPGTNC